MELDRAGDESRLLTVPNALSLARLLSVPVFLWLFLTDRTDAAVILYAIGAWTDFLDGYIARRTHTVTNFGKLLDPLADRILIIALCLALIGRGALPWWLVLAIVIRDLLLLSLFPVLERKGVERIPVNRTGKAATALLFLGLTLLAVSETSLPWGAGARTVGLPVVVGGAVLYWVAAGMYAIEAKRRLEGSGGLKGLEA